MVDFKEHILKILEKKDIKGIELEVPPDPNLGDYALPCFSLAKILKKSPQEIASDLVIELNTDEYISEIKQVGHYVNFFIDKSLLAEHTIPSIIEGSYFNQDKKKEKVVVEFLSPNTNKSLHLGHLRNGFLGEALSNILKYKGFQVIKTSLNNDRGTGVTEAMLGYKLFHDNEEPKIKGDHFVAQCYVDFKKAEKANPELKEKVKEMLLKWEQGDKETVEIWKKLMKFVKEGYKETYKKIGFDFDKEYNESEIYKKGKDIVLDGLKKGIFEKEDGAVFAKLERYDLPDKALIKSDGTSLYITQDIYLAKLKDEDFDMDRSIYVVGAEQDLHFRQLFKILELLGFKFSKNCHHLSYGLVNLPSGRMKSREGSVVDADDLIEEVISLARKEVEKRYSDIDKKEVQKRAEIIGLGALKFFMLKFENNKSFTYDPEESLAFEGETGPYVQYAHARICSILRKSENVKEADFSLLKEDEEKDLIDKLALFDDVIENSSKSYKPSLLARYLIDLSQSFNEFYVKCQILKEEDNLKDARLMLIMAVKEVLKKGLNLLSIEAPEAM